MNEDRTAIMSARALASGYEIMWYTIQEVLGQGGFGITYLALDRNLDRHVAIKEYLPTPFAYRHQDYSVKPLTGDHRENYSWGLDSFLKEAQTLAKFGHENIVRVHTVFEANNTAYMVMEYEHGENLASIYKNAGQSLNQQFFETTFFPIFRGLEEIHQFGFIHRDIKPANIYIRENGTPVLIDFGSARQTSQQQTGEMTTLVSKGYTPLEQYSSNYGDQGPWTDIYALAASMYEGVVGAKPDEALSRSACMLRSKPDLVERLSAGQYPNFEQQFLDGIFTGLALEPEGRPQDLSHWLQQFRDPTAIGIQGSGDEFDLLQGHQQAQQAAGFDDFPDLPNQTVLHGDTAQPGHTRTAPPHAMSPGGVPASNTTHTQSGSHTDVEFDFPDPALEPDPGVFDDMVRPGTHLHQDAPAGNTRDGSSAPASRSASAPAVAAKKGKSLPIALALGIAGLAVGGYFFYQSQQDGGTAGSPQSVASMPRPATPVNSVLAEDLTVRQLEELVVLAGFYQQAHQLDNANPEVLAGVTDVYASLNRLAGNWNKERYPEIGDLIEQAHQALPGTRQQGSELQATLAATGQNINVDRVKALINADSIMEPVGASVFDAAKQLGEQEFQLARSSEEWQQMMRRFHASAVQSLKASDFDSAVRIVEAALSIDPDNVQMRSIEKHLKLQ